MWILERQGNKNKIDKYSSFEDAQEVMQREYEEEMEYREECMSEFCDETCAAIGDEDFYQSWCIYEEKQFDSPIDELIDKIEMELSRADRGITQYSYELMDTDVASNHIYKALNLIDKLKELI